MKLEATGAKRMLMARWKFASFVLIALIVPSFLTVRVKALDEDSHYDLKYYLLIRVGFTANQAGIVARADASEDKGNTEAGFNSANNVRYHALGTKAQNDVRQTELWNRHSTPRLKSKC